MKEYGVVQQIFQNGEQVDATVICDGMYSNEFATEVAREIALDYAKYLLDITYVPSYECKFVACELREMI